MWTEVDLPLPALQKTLVTVYFRKQSILICSKGAAKKNLPISSHAERLLAVSTHVSTMLWIGNEKPPIQTSPNLCSPAKYQGGTRSASLPAVVRFSRRQVLHVCVLLGRTHSCHQVLQWCYMPGLPLSHADICVQGIPPCTMGDPVW